MNDPDLHYLRGRERVERAMASVATDPASRAIHLELASLYRRRIADAEPVSDGHPANLAR